MIRRALSLALALSTLAASLAVPSLLGCGPVRERVLSATPTVPRAEATDAAPYSSRCNGAVPEVLSASGRWWPAHPAGSPCPWGCVVDADGARCDAPPDGGYHAAP